MKNRLILPILIVLTSLMMVLPTAVQALEILRWERIPLAVPLIVDQERVIFIDRNVRVGVPASLGDRLRVQSTGGTLYLRANAPIEPTRLQLQDADSGALILLDIAATPAEAKQTPLEPIRIVASDFPSKTYGDQLSEDEDEAADSDKPRRETPIPVVLTRYAAQSLYAPLRTVEPVQGITRVSVRRNLPISSLMPTLPLRAQVLAAWRLDEFWVTAVRLTHTGQGVMPLDPRALQGDFVSATFQHPDLGPAGDPSDTTVLYLVTRGHGLAESLLPALSPIDASRNLPGAKAKSALTGGDHEK
ncbi:TIGR03749 family integrating conjugative element protein [Serratia fonticola]|uniref:TIGR03749 family integrating conjugative element protein n=1 Tax=Serratia fonticola TaxID=47917 RepID=UPI00192B57F9|nr:TIGR03749 family integrating conjugative element protein [Serratia fonticola]MBL5862124.1 TIGR03749 family integrating conjugative element protein [Serratia fonticola]